MLVAVSHFLPISLTLCSDTMVRCFSRNSFGISYTAACTDRASAWMASCCLLGYSMLGLMPSISGALVAFTLLRVPMPRDGDTALDNDAMHLSIAMEEESSTPSLPMMDMAGAVGVAAPFICVVDALIAAE